MNCQYKKPGSNIAMRSHSKALGVGSWLLLLASLAFIGGCAGKTTLMPTPSLYAWGNFNPFEDVPRELQNNHVDVLYLTDRAPEGMSKTGVVYGYKRSRSVAFGVSEVDFGNNVSWDELVKASRSTTRTIGLDLNVAKTTELTRFSPTPRSLVELSHPSTRTTVSSPPYISLLGDDENTEELAAEAVFKRELSARLAVTPQKEVYLFIHGYDNNFNDSVNTIAEVWHFLGRQGVPIAYSWPAGSTGLLRGYTYDSASSEFTVFHLKQMIRLIASCPDVQKINIIGHSRGTDTTINALRELHIELHGQGKDTRKLLKLGTVVLAAPDIDIDIVIQKFTTVRLGQVPEHFCLYVCSKDKALGLSSWLFGGLKRLGELQADMFSPAELELLRSTKSFQIVDVRTTQIGPFGHDYFHSSPAVSSDLILLMRYGLEPGAETGRPLRITDKGFWAIDDSYPGPPNKITNTATSK